MNENLELKIGPYTVCAIPTGIFGLDGGAMFGTVPKVLWEKAIPADANNRIPMEARALLLKSETHGNVLIDCGNGADFIAKYGEKLGSKFAEMYNIDPQGVSLAQSLSQHQMKPSDINSVILTHLHFDHCGGGVIEKNGQLIPAFPQAKYFIQKKNLETASSPNLREKGSYFSANFKPLLDAGVLNIIDGETENLLPNISVLISDGHTAGQQMVKISDGTTTLLYCADVVPTSAHVRIPWLMGYDLHPLALMEEKIKILSRAADEGWYLYFEHDPHCDIAKIARHGSDFSVSHRYSLKKAST